MKKKFQYVKNYDKANELCPKDCVVVAMKGYTVFRDFYLFVPFDGIFFRCANCSRYGEFMEEIFIDGGFVGASPISKHDKIKQLYEADYVSEAQEYALGHMLWRETTPGGKHINKYKEAARISHDMCDAGGSAGHEARQYIRRNILNKEAI